MKDAIIEIKEIDSDCIKVLGITYYTEHYLEEMMRREYQRGIRDGREVHVIEFQFIEL